MKLLFCFICVIFSLQTQATTSTWSEGKCDELNNRYEGATRDYYNRGAGKSWQHKQGDWIDAKLDKQGKKPFSLTHISNTKKGDTVEINTTLLTQFWQKRIIDNHGFFIKKLKGDASIFYSKDIQNKRLIPRLQVSTLYKTYNLIASADIELDLSTYRCINKKQTLNSYHNLLLRFDMTNIKEKIISSKLVLTLAKDTNQSFLQLFAVNIKEHNTIKTFSLSDKYSNDAQLKLDPSVFYFENFNNYSWMDKWGVDYRGNFRITNKNETEKFRPLDKSALEIVIKKGKHIGISAHYPLKNAFNFKVSKVTSAYFRYNLRLGNNWHLITPGKILGFSGIYDNESYRGGWGGRKSNGSNGWSARGMITPTLSKENTLPDRTPLGSYIYHADMKMLYGDQKAWNLNDISVLKKNTWYSIEQYVHMNTIGKNNGILKAWVNGILVYTQNNIRFSDNPAIGIESVWLDVYHGGNETAPKDLTLFIDNLIIASKHIGYRINKN